jgi:hypothetical protein
MPEQQGWRVVIVGPSPAGLCGAEALFDGPFVATGTLPHTPWTDWSPKRDVYTLFWSSAVGQAQVAARNLAAPLAGARPTESYATVPYFWSDQHDWKLQFVGFGGAGPDRTRVEVDAGAVEDARFVATYRRDGRLVGALCVNWPAQVSRYRRRIVADWQDAGSRTAAASASLGKGEV